MAEKTFNQSNVADIIRSDISIDIRIGAVVRTVEEHVLRFFREYEELHSMIQISSDIEEDIKKMQSCKEKLEQIIGICANELKGLQQHHAEILMFKSNSDKYQKVIEDIDRMIRDLGLYVLNLKSVIVEVNSKKIIDENAKKDMERAINLLHKEYDDFTKNNSEAIANLQSIESLSRN